MMAARKPFGKLSRCTTGGDIRGKTSSLNDRELEDLVNYVQSL